MNKRSDNGGGSGEVDGVSDTTEITNMVVADLIGDLIEERE